MAAVGERAVAPDPPSADALEEAPEEVDPIGALRPAAAGLWPAHILDPRPQLVGDRRVAAPRRRLARLVAAPPVAADPAVVERVHQDHPDPALGQPGLLGEVLRAHVAEGVALEQADDDADRVGVDLEDVRRLRGAPEAEPGVAARVVAAVELGGVAVGDPLREPAAVLLRPGRLRDQLVPVVRVGREDPPVAHDERDAGRVEVVLEELEGPPEVALPAVGVPGEEQVERPRSARRRASRPSSPSARRWCRCGRPGTRARCRRGRGAR